MIDFRFTKHFRSEVGGNGGSKNMHGKNGKDMIIKVPCGTVIRDNETNLPLFMGAVTELN